MSSITDGLLGQLQGQPLNQIGQHLGISPSQAAGAVAAALPLLIGALGRNTRQPAGAESLFGALQKDHVGQDLPSVLGSALGGGGQGNQILGHIFGPRQDVAAQGLGTATGLAPDRASMLLRLLAPVAMAYIAKRMYDRRTANAATPASAGAPATPAAAPTPQDLGQVLGQEERQITQQGGLAGGLLGAVLDRNHDGKVDFSDLIGLGGSAIGRV
jgi:hypothetical protein